MMENKSLTISKNRTNNDVPLGIEVVFVFSACKKYLKGKVRNKKGLHLNTKNISKALLDLKLYLLWKYVLKVSWFPASQAH